MTSRIFISSTKLISSCSIKVPYRLCSPIQSLKPTHEYVRRTLASAAGSRRKKLIILGTGWGGYAVLKKVNKELYDVMVVSPRNHFLFTPLLASTTVGTLEFRSIIEPVRNTVFRQTDHFHLSHAINVDTNKQEITCQSVLQTDNCYTLAYDKLVIAVGALSNTFGVPGVEEHACYLKEVADARKIRNRILSNFELAILPGLEPGKSGELLHIVIVGGGPTGVEFGAELYDFVQQDVVRLFSQLKDQVRVTLIESNQILSSFDGKLRKFAEKKMKQRAGFSLLKSSVVEVGSDYVKLADGQRLGCGLVVWSTGLAPRYFTQQVSLPKNRHGQILTDSHLQVLDTPPATVYALGDCADITDYPLPCTAQVAERQGLYLARKLNRRDADGDGDRFNFSSGGMLAYIGDYQGLSDLPDFKLEGFPSWFLWRSAYLTQLGSWRLRLQVPIDWLKTFIYGRDISRF